MKYTGICRTLVAAVVLVGIGGAASAQFSFTVNLNTALISGNPVYLEYSLSDGTVTDGTGPSTANTATIGDFLFGGGAAGTVQTPIGNATGNITSKVNLADGDPAGVADFAQGFTAGSTLQFDVTLSQVVQAGTPDEFLFRILDSGFNYIPTTDGSGNNAFVKVDITKSNLGISDVSVYSGTGPNIPAPQITLKSTTATPEPGTLALFTGLGAASLFGLRRRVSRR